MQGKTGRGLLFPEGIRWHGSASRKQVQYGKLIGGRKNFGKGERGKKKKTQNAFKKIWSHTVSYARIRDRTLTDIWRGLILTRLSN